MVLINFASSQLDHSRSSKASKAHSKGVQTSGFPSARLISSGKRHLIFSAKPLGYTLRTDRPRTQRHVEPQHVFQLSSALCGFQSFSATVAHLSRGLTDITLHRPVAWIHRKPTVQLQRPHVEMLEPAVVGPPPLVFRGSAPVMHHPPLDGKHLTLFSHALQSLAETRSAVPSAIESESSPPSATKQVALTKSSLHDI